ncbi:cation transporter [Rhodocytophaga rosea]|uniref:Cation transporter n=2 Tax=Rhodocytophaga rosea TaxID=2704465 RepID=A0A6C0GWJ7_9BACT|nr:cation transporter [Rhodocytophaga rosea]
MLLKFIAYYLTGSNAVLTDALESIINVMASGFAFYSIYLSAQPKDNNHPYGHGKIEYFSAGFEGALIFLAGLFIIYQALQNLVTPQPIRDLPLGMVIIAITGIVNGVLGYYLKTKGNNLHSITLVADGKHLLVDSMSSLILAAGIALIYYTNLVVIDSLLSLSFAFLILYNGYKLIRRSVAGLMDEADAETLSELARVLNENKNQNWIDIHNLRVQKYGADLHIDCHLTLPYYLDLKKVHDEVHQLEDVVKAQFAGNVEVFVHVDPCLPEDCCHYCPVATCPVRRAAFSKNIPWTIKNLSQNQKHFVDEKLNKATSSIHGNS